MYEHDESIAVSYKLFFNQLRLKKSDACFGCSSFQKIFMVGQLFDFCKHMNQNSLKPFCPE
jgi:hypothetical protein